MKLKLFIIFSLFVCLSSFVTAIDEYDISAISYLSMDNANISGNTALDLTTNGNNGVSNNGTSTGSTGIFNEAFSFDGIDDDLSFTDEAILQSDGQFTVSMWFNADTIAVSEQLAGKWGGGEQFLLRFDASDKIEAYVKGNSGTVGPITTSVISTGTWYHVLLTYDSTIGLNLYLNNVKTNGAAQGDMFTAANRLTMGYYWNGGDGDNYFDGLMDEVLIMNRSVNDSEAEFLYNSGVFTKEQQFPFVATTGVFEISAFADYNNASILNFSVDINGSIYNTTNGTIHTDLLKNDTSLYNFTVFSSDWYNVSFFNQSVVSNLDVGLSQTDIEFRIIFSNGDLIPQPTNITITDLNNSLVFTTNTSTLNFSPTAENITYQIECNDEVFAPFNQTFSFSALQNETINVTVNETQNLLTFLDANTTSPIENATVTVYYPSGSTDALVTDVNGSVSFSYIKDSVVEFGNYTFEFDKVGYSLLNITDTINSSLIPINNTYNISRASITINVYNRDGHQLLSGENVSLAMVGVFNDTTTTGTLIKNNLSLVSGEYIIYASNDAFKTETRSFSFTNQESITVDFYLLNLSDPNIGSLQVTTTDSFFRKITDAKVELLEYSPSDLSFISVSECRTNINAECSFNLELNTKTYYIRGTTTIAGQLLIAETSQNGEIITSSGQNRNIIFYTRTDFEVSQSDNLIYSITESFVNNISQISVDFNTYDGTAQTVCVEYFIKQGRNYTSVTGDTYCVTASAAIQNIDTSVTLNRSNDYEARIYIKNPTYDNVLKVYNYPSSISMSEVFNNDFKGALILILWIVLLSFAMHSKNMTLFFIGGIFLSWAEVIFFPTFTIVSISVAKTLICLGGYVVSRKKIDYQ